VTECLLIHRLPARAEVVGDILLRFRAPSTA
jgi:hypothetical protein